MDIFFVYLVLLFLIFNKIVEAACPQEFNVQVLDYTICKGPKRKNCTDVILTSGNGYMLTNEVYVKQNVIITHGQVIGKSVKGKKEFPLQMKKPCDHFFVKKRLEQFFNIRANCLLEKNHYRLSVNLKEIINSFNKYIGNYFTGEWIYDTLFYGTECNVFCNRMHLKISPIK